MASGRTPTRVFIDSSVFIAAAISPSGGARELLLRGERGELHLMVSDFVLEETRRNLAAKAPAALGMFQLFIEQDFVETVPSPARSLVLRVAESIELKDAPIVAAAMVGEAQYLATHDTKHLLTQSEAINRAFGIITATPGDILQAGRN